MNNNNSNSSQFERDWPAEAAAMQRPQLRPAYHKLQAAYSRAQQQIIMNDRAVREAEARMAELAEINKSLIDLMVELRPDLAREVFGTMAVAATAPVPVPARSPPPPAGAHVSGGEAAGGNANGNN